MEKTMNDTYEQIMPMLDKLYNLSIKGVGNIVPPIEEVIENYLSKEKSVEAAAKSFINYQIAKCTTSGFLTNLGGVITLPIAIPANIGSVMYVQMRMIAGIAYMGGFDISDDQVQTLVYACLAMLSVNAVVKNVAVKFGNKFTMEMVKRIPRTLLSKINQRVGFKLFTKLGNKGLINIGKMVPVIGGVIGGGFDLVETKLIANRAYKLFIRGELDEVDEHTPLEEIITVEEGFV